MALAWMLEPDARGYGTHQRLGLPPCSFRIVFGMPCPGCGGTTSFAYFVRGAWWQAASSNLAGFGCALMSALMIPWSLASAVSGRTWGLRDPLTAFVWLLAILASLSGLQWLARVFAYEWL